MANDKDIKIGIATTADTSGADKTVTALDKLLGVEERRKQTAADFLTAAEREVAEIDRMATSARKLAAAKEEEARAAKDVLDAARREQAVLDVLEAKRRLSARGVQLQSGEMKNLGSFATQAGYQITDFAVQMQSGTSVVTAFSQQFPQLIASVQQSGLALGKNGLAGALGASVGAGTAFTLILTELGIGIGLTAQAYQEMSKAISNADRAVEIFKQSLATAERQRVDLAGVFRDDIAKQLNVDASAAKHLGEELANVNRIAQANERLAAARAKAGGAGDGQLSVEALAAAAAQRERDIAAAQQRVNTASGNVGLQQQTVSAFPAGSNAADLDAARQKLQQFRDELQSAENELTTLTAESATNLRTKAVETAQAVGDEATQNFTKLGEDLRTQLQGIAATEGAQTSAAVTAALQGVNQILADGKIQADEVGKLGQSLGLFRQSLEAGTQETQNQINRMINLLLSQKNQLDESNRKIAALEARGTQ